MAAAVAVVYPAIQSLEFDAKKLDGPSLLLLINYHEETGFSCFHQAIDIFLQTLGDSLILGRKVSGKTLGTLFHLLSVGRNEIV